MAMKIERSQEKLPDLFEYDELLKMFKYFSTLTGLDISLHDLEGEEQLAFRVKEEYCLCCALKVRHNHESCKKNMQYAAGKAAELGEPYIYNCCCMVKCSVPIIFAEKLMGSIACGPFLLWEPDDITRAELSSFMKGKALAAPTTQKIIEHINYFTGDYITSAAQMLYIIVNYITKGESKYLAQSKEVSWQQRQIAALLMEKKQYAFDKRPKLKKYPVDMEKELIAYVQTGEKTNAKRLLNDLLSEIFSISSGNLDIIKAKIYELTAILMRAAVDIGAPLESMSQYINYYNNILSEHTTFEELCYITSEVLEVFMAVVYEHRPEKKANKHLNKAINFIKDNYHRELSLKSVADAIFLSSDYLSHLFRDELDTTFTDYLTQIRMEESLRLMKDTPMRVNEIATAVGFNDANYYSKAFKKFYGVTPKKYQQTFAR